MSEGSVARRVAQHLLRIGAVAFAPEDPYTWSSGLKAPIYCDNRLTISYPDVRRYLRDAFAGTLDRHGLKPEVIAGTATAGIPHAAWLADVRDLPMVYVRGKPKGHGLGSQIEGRLGAHPPVVVIEDLVSTGGSVQGVVQALRAEGANVLAVLAVFSYELDASRRTLEELAVPLHTLTRFDELFEVALETGALSKESIETIRAWRANPELWSSRHT